MSNRTPAVQARVASLAREVAVAIEAARITPEAFLRMVEAAGGRPPRGGPDVARGVLAPRNVRT